MNTYTTYITSISSISQADSIIYLDQLTIKGVNSIYFNLTGVSQSTKIRKIDINYGDFSESEIYFRGITNDTIQIVFNHSFTPTTATYFLLLSSVIGVVYENDVTTKFITPFRIAQGSLYDDIDSIFVYNSQLLPNSNTSLNFTGNNTQYTFIGVLSN